MSETRVLLVYPGSLFGGRWADGPRVKPELVSLFSELGRARPRRSTSSTLEAELGNPGDDAAREEFLAQGRGPAGRAPADLVVVSCWSALQYSAAVAVAERVRRLHPAAVIAVEGYHVSVRPDDFAYEGAPFNWLVVGEAESAVVALAQAVADGDRDTLSCRPVEGTPLPLDARPPARLRRLPVRSRGPPRARALPEPRLPLQRARLSAAAGRRRLARLPARRRPSPARPRRRRSSPSGSTSSTPPSATTRRGGAQSSTASRRATGATSPISLNGRPDALVRLDLDKFYAARVRLRLDVGTLSRELLSRTGQAPQPQRAVEHALDLLTYANAKGLVTAAAFTFNQPGETAATARETLDALERFVDEVPNTSVSLQAESWAYLPAGEPAADLDAPASRFGTRILAPEWWKQAAPFDKAARVGRRERGARRPGAG